MCEINGCYEDGAGIFDQDMNELCEVCYDKQIEATKSWGEFSARNARSRLHGLLCANDNLRRNNARVDGKYKDV
jgi:hypothetical protein